MQNISEDMLRDAAVEWQLTSTRFDEWFKSDLFSLRWWLLLGVFVLSIYIWWKLVDKSRLNEIMLFSSIVAIIILTLDELGEELTLWDYPTDIFPLFPPIGAIDLACLPLLYSLIYQYFKSWKSYITAAIVMSFISCFVLEPLFVLTGIYQMITWKSYYGLPLYFSIAVCSKFILAKIYAIESKHRSALKD